ncbi:anticodon-binding protein [Thamnocephalis sphaerospora]|uniref:Anticodon-binding protein n=1 Tax=Thamnocephalis sphaerospora TaxID=78915 RepID=A0A4V1IWT6_9FUNG|nr:anticodon-binding protein [Thamnocephalis sphaerospora]|eukprot:RKP08689.1 anticodon-binding protein [Thamnocephalis sphaerospora]
MEGEHAPNLSNVKNKLKRQELYAKLVQKKARKERDERLRRKREEKADPTKGEERRAKNIPKTLESTREFDETVVEEQDDEATDEFAEYFTGQAPKVLITTSKYAAKPTYQFAEELLSIFPTGEFVRRGAKFEIKQIVEFCKNREYTDLMIVNEDKKEPNAITLIHLPNGPTAYFKLTSIQHHKDIHNHGRITSHHPELILNNFNTRLGHTVGRMFAALFPQVPQFEGRQVCTLHNQRDFIFFRRHRYMFRSGKRADLQEIGPRFTLKLKWLQKGTFDRQNGQMEWEFKSEMETSRRRFFL